VTNSEEVQSKSKKREKTYQEVIEKLVLRRSRRTDPIHSGGAKLAMHG